MLMIRTTIFYQLQTPLRKPTVPKAAYADRYERCERPNQTHHMYAKYA